MPSQQQQQNQQGKSSEQEKVPFPTLPKALEHRISMKWLTMEALCKVNKLLAVDRPESRVMLLTSWGQVEGKLNPILPSYAESYREENGQLTADYASMVTHIRTDLLRLYEKEEGQGQEGQEQKSQLEIVDTAPILSLTDVVLRSGGTTTTLPQLTLFADQVIGFTLIETPQIH